MPLGRTSDNTRPVAAAVPELLYASVTITLDWPAGPLYWESDFVTAIDALATVTESVLLAAVAPPSVAVMVRVPEAACAAAELTTTAATKRVGWAAKAGIVRLVIAVALSGTPSPLASM